MAGSGVAAAPSFTLAPPSPPPSQTEQTGSPMQIPSIASPGPGLSIRSILSHCRQEFLLQIVADERQIGSSTAPRKETAKISAKFGELEDQANGLFDQFESFFGDYAEVMAERNILLKR